mmetsp:Transcript_9207/g.25491  ORF Transcript_9207/g.25491 Transcript_9207/m.25491 type:complete len:229 (-) Transcript_9207:1992-2678(-)
MISSNVLSSSTIPFALKSSSPNVIEPVFSAGRVPPVTGFFLNEPAIAGCPSSKDSRRRPRPSSGSGTIETSYSRGLLSASDVSPPFVAEDRGACDTPGGGRGLEQISDEAVTSGVTTSNAEARPLLVMASKTGGHPTSPESGHHFSKTNGSSSSENSLGIRNGLIAMGAGRRLSSLTLLKFARISVAFGEVISSGCQLVGRRDRVPGCLKVTLIDFPSSSVATKRPPT